MDIYERLRTNLMHTLKLVEFFFFFLIILEWIYPYFNIYNIDANVMKVNGIFSRNHFFLCKCEECTPKCVNIFVDVKRNQEKLNFKMCEMPSMDC